MRRQVGPGLGALPRSLPARLAAAVVSLVVPLVVLLVLLVVLGLGAAPASAHAAFVGSDPAEGSQVAVRPDAVVLRYSEDIAPQFVEAAVLLPDGSAVPTGARVDGTAVTVDLAGAGVPDLAGSWQVVARVVSVDGHPVETTTTFVVQDGGPAGTAAGAPSVDPGTSGPTTGTTTGTGAEPTRLRTDPAAAVRDSLPRWALVAGAAGLVLAAAAALLVQLRRRPPTG